jgi:hypothetical protein
MEQCVFRGTVPLSQVTRLELVLYQDHTATREEKARADAIVRAFWAWWEKQKERNAHE